MTFKFAAALTLLLAPASQARGGETAAVLSSGGVAYLEAFTAFQAVHGSPVPYCDISK